MRHGCYIGVSFFVLKLSTLSNFEHTGSKRERFVGPGIMEIDHRPDTTLPTWPQRPPYAGAVSYYDAVAVTFADGTLIIQILHIDDLITTECESASQAQAAFEELVDGYIRTCAELNKPPSKPFKGSFNVRVSPELHRAIAMQASENGETMNAWVESALKEKVERQNSYKRLFRAEAVSKIFESSFEGRWSAQTFEFRQETGVPVVFTRARSFYN